MSFLKELANRIQLKSADPQSFHHLCQKISVTIQRFSSVAILGSIVPFCSIIFSYTVLWAVVFCVCLFYNI